MANNFKVIILAAGSSSRLGQPKQLVLVNEVTLLNRTILEAKKSRVEDVYIVLGANRDLIIPTLPDRTNIIVNTDWKMGMGKSIAVAVDEIVNEETDGVIVLLADQVYLMFTYINNLIERHLETSKNIIVCRYNEGQGPPSFFSKKYFQELTQLNNDFGAKEIIKKNKNDVDWVAFPKGYIDIDTIDDLALINS